MFRSIVVVFLLFVGLGNALRLGPGVYLRPLKGEVLTKGKVREPLVRPSLAAKLLGNLVVGALLFAGSPSTSNAEIYTNARYGVDVEIPNGWIYNKGQLSGERKLEAWTNPEVPGTSVSLVFTPIPADFTRLTSFGGSIREYLVPRGEGIECEIISEKTKGEQYTLEYIVSAPDNPTRHVATVFALRPAESVVGLTVQSEQKDFAKQQKVLDAIVPSLKVN